MNFWHLFGKFSRPFSSFWYLVEPSSFTHPTPRPIRQHNTTPYPHPNTCAVCLFDHSMLYFIFVLASMHVILFNTYTHTHQHVMRDEYTAGRRRLFSFSYLSIWTSSYFSMKFSCPSRCQNRVKRENNVTCLV